MILKYLIAQNNKQIVIYIMEIIYNTIHILKISRVNNFII